MTNFEHATRIPFMYGLHRHLLPTITPSIASFEVKHIYKPANPHTVAFIAGSLFPGFLPEGHPRWLKHW
jgi:hypothetical protein